MFNLFTASLTCVLNFSDFSSLNVLFYPLPLPIETVTSKMFVCMNEVFSL